MSPASSTSKLRPYFFRTSLVRGNTTIRSPSTVPPSILPMLILNDPSNFSITLCWAGVAGLVGTGALVSFGLAALTAPGRLFSRIAGFFVFPAAFLACFLEVLDFLFKNYHPNPDPWPSILLPPLIYLTKSRGLTRLVSPGYWEALGQLFYLFDGPEAKLIGYAGHCGARIVFYLSIV